MAGDATVQDQRDKILFALGNIAGVTAVDDRVQVGQEGITPRYLTVREGKTPRDVAVRAYGDPHAANSF
ncbi:hypothetical protein [Streptomyces aureocirculatus]|uniref:hypothetical protein n=1 Tax=Streptomyces aureocirculatus TaxID=67275 RepID=UPI000689521C|nr:hypothetical protein [Streptomyces aureocirculatus]